MKKLKKYPAYKDSGIEWIGDIPEHWEVTLLRSFMRNKSVKGFPNLRVLSVYRDYGVIPKDSRNDNHNVTSSDTSNYKVVQVGDFVINKMKAWQGSMGISNYKGIVSPAYITSSLDTSQVHGLFIHRILRSHLYIDEYNRLSYGVRVGQWDMHFQDFKNIQIPLPPLSEQKEIASFLDKKTAEIDKAIELKQKENELLKERRQVAINQAVTRGLDPNVRLKDSGIEWIGDIPEHWEVRKLKHAANIVTEKGNSNTYANLFLGMENILSFSGKKNGLSILPNAEGIVYKNDDILFGKLRPYLSKVYLSKEKGICSSEFLVLRPLYVLSNFLKYSCLSNSFVCKVDSSTYGAKMPRASISFIANLQIPLPPLSEQKEIAKYLEELDSKTNRLLELNNQAIAKLKEYKQVLIDQAVRGQICLV